jgi:small subunit ribosomal protein S11
VSDEEQAPAQHETPDEPAPEAAAAEPIEEAAAESPAAIEVDAATTAAQPETAPQAEPAAETPSLDAAPAAAAFEGADAVEAVGTRRRGRRDVAHGQAHIGASFNNTIISITDLQGNSLAWTSGGSVGFKGSRKSTPYAAQVAAEQAARRAGEFGVRKLDVIVRGSGAGRETAVRTLQNMGMEVTGIVDITPTPHNGCREKKKRRG